MSAPGSHASLGYTPQGPAAWPHSDVPGARASSSLGWIFRSQASELQSSSVTQGREKERQGHMGRRGGKLKDEERTHRSVTPPV